MERERERKRECERERAMHKQTVAVLPPSHPSLPINEIDIMRSRSANFGAIVSTDV